MDLKINMVGRWAVWPVMFAIFLTLLVDSWVATASLYVGLVADALGDGDLLRRRLPLHASAQPTLKLDLMVGLYSPPGHERMASDGRHLPDLGALSDQELKELIEA